MTNVPGKSESRVWNGNSSLSRLLVPLADLEAHPSNPRVHNIPALRESLAAFGQQRPVLVVPAGRLGERATIVAGHGTVRAATAEGYTHIAVVVSDLEDTDINRYLLADNRSSDLGAYDDSLLLALLNSLDSEGLVATGYTDSDHQELIAMLTVPVELERAARSKSTNEQPYGAGTSALFRIVLTYSEEEYQALVAAMEREMEAHGDSTFSGVIARVLAERQS